MRPAIAFLLSAGVSALALRVFAQHAAARLVRDALAAIPGRSVRVGRVELGFADPSVKLSPVTLFQPDTGEELARLESARAFVRVRPAGVSLGAIHLRRPELRVHPYLAELLSMRPRAAESLPALSVRDGIVTWPAAPGQPLRIEQIRLDVSSEPGGGSSGSGSLALPGGTADFFLRGRHDAFAASATVRVDGNSFPVLGALDPRGTFAFQAAVGPAGRIRASAQPRGATLRVPGADRPIESIEGEVGVDGDRVGIELRGRADNAALAARATGSLRKNAPFDAEFEAGGLDLATLRGPLETLGPAVREAFEALLPQGTLDVRGRLRWGGGGATGAAEARFRDLSIRCEGFRDHESGRIHGFPYPAKFERATVSLRPDRVWIHEAVGAIGPAPLDVRGEIGIAPNRELDLGIRARGLPLDGEVRRALGRLEGGVEAFDEFGPEGPADVALRLFGVPGEHRLRYELGLTARGGSARWSGFPLRVHGLDGTVTVSEDLIACDLAGTASGGRVRVRARVAGPRTRPPGPPPDDPTIPAERLTPRPALLVRVSAESLEITDELLRAVTALAPDAGPSLARVAPRGGRVGFEAWVVRPRAGSDDDLVALVRVSIGDLALTLPGLDVEAEGVSGELTFSRRHGKTSLHADTFEGRALGATLFGSVGHRDAPPETSWEVNGVGIPIDASLQERAAAAVDAPFLRPEALEAFGSFDLLARGRLREGLAGATSTATVRLRDVDLRGKRERFAIDGISGTLEIGPDGVASTGEGIACRLAGADARVRNLQVATGEAGARVSFAADVRDLPLDAPLQAVLPDGLARPLGRLALSGRADARLERVVVGTDPDGAPSVEVQGAIALREASVDPGIPISSLLGSLEDVRLSIGGGRLGASASLVASRARLLGLAVTDLAAALRLSEDRFAVSDLRGTIAGGELRARGEDRAEKEAFVVRLSEPSSPFAASLTLRRAELRALLAEVLPRARDLAGTLDARVEFEGNTGDLDSLRGHGTIEVDDGKLWEVPVLREIRPLLPEPASGIATFERGEANFVIGDGRFRFRQLHLWSPLFAITGVRGGGELDFAGNLDLLFDTSLLPIVSIPVVSRVFAELRNLFLPKILTVAVRGPLEAPKVTLRTPIARDAPGVLKRPWAPAPFERSRPARF